MIAIDTCGQRYLSHALQQYVLFIVQLYSAASCRACHQEALPVVLSELDSLVLSLTRMLLGGTLISLFSQSRSERLLCLLPTPTFCSCGLVRIKPSHHCWMGRQNESGDLNASAHSRQGRPRWHSCHELCVLSLSFVKHISQAASFLRPSRA